MDTHALFASDIISSALFGTAANSINGVGLSFGFETTTARGLLSVL